MTEIIWQDVLANLDRLTDEMLQRIIKHSDRILEERRDKRIQELHEELMQAKKMMDEWNEKMREDLSK